jgi:hypothetical protein
MPMTDAEWLACADPIDLLRFIKQHRGMRRPKKQRKQRLFSVACCRRIWSLIVDERSRGSVEVVERFADDLATKEELQAAEAEANANWLKNAGAGASFACDQLFWKNGDGMHVSTTTISAVFEQQQKEANKPVEPLGGRRRGACPSEELEHCKLLRCIFGNPFRRSPPVPAAVLAWNDRTIPRLAEAIYQERKMPQGTFDTGRLAILADALLDAGCEDEELIQHCRGEGPHVRGCWAVDLILGKS